MDDQFLLGHALLHKPITMAGALKSRIYLPRETLWYEYFSLKEVPNGWLDQLVDLSRMLLFIRGGTVIARKSRPRRSTNQMKSDPYALVIALDHEVIGEIVFCSICFVIRDRPLEQSTLMMASPMLTQRALTFIEPSNLLQIVAASAITVSPASL